MKVSKNTRKNSRLKTPLLLRYEVKDMKGKKQVGQSIDISEGGIKFSTPRKFKVDEEISLQVLLPGVDSILNLKGKVLRVIPRKVRRSVFSTVVVTFGKSGKDAAILRRIVKDICRDKKELIFSHLSGYHIRKTK